MQRGSLPVCLCQALIRVTESLSSVSLTKRKTLIVWMSVFVFALKYGLFMLRFMHLCVWPRGQLGAGRGGSVVSGHAWIVALFSSIVQSQQQSVCHRRKHLSLLRHIKEDGHLLCFTAQGYHEVNTSIYSSTLSGTLVLFCIWWFDKSS